ncbi:MAG: hypothetical protein ACP5D7_16585 [Limnospira sp.]
MTIDNSSSGVARSETGFLAMSPDSRLPTPDSRSFPRLSEKILPRLYNSMCIFTWPSPRKLIQIGCILLMAGGIAACRQIADSTAKLNLNTTKIEAIAQNRKVGATVYLRGTVENRAPFLGAGAYKLADRTGTVWVFTTEPLPPVGEKMLLRGRVNYEAIEVVSAEKLDIGDFYIEELERITEEKPESEPAPTQGKIISIPTASAMPSPP